MQIKIKYFNKDSIKIEKIDKGDWIDLRVNSVKLIQSESIIGNSMINEKPLLERRIVETVLTPKEGYWEEDGEEKLVKYIEFKKGDFLLIDLGVAIELPEDHEGYILPRSSTFKNFGLIQTNGKGIIDEIYKGDNDIWLMPVLAQRDGFIMMDERICQFRINKKMPTLDITEVKHLGNDDRGGHGSTGTK